LQRGRRRFQRRGAGHQRGSDCGRDRSDREGQRQRDPRLASRCDGGCGGAGSRGRGSGVDGSGSVGSGGRFVGEVDSIVAFADAGARDAPRLRPLRLRDY
jgi:hypothetical protein